MTDKQEQDTAGVRVKPLEWAVGDWTFVAHTPFGDYDASENRDQWIAGGLFSGTYQTIDAFQAAAQADYERRILSALTTS